ncbi:MAG: hypothetical protein QM749_02555, partial [Aquabacterium sp.]
MPTGASRKRRTRWAFCTETQYDAFGNAAKHRRTPTAASGYFFFDQLNQAAWQVDPTGYATQTSYNTLG